MSKNKEKHHLTEEVKKNVPLPEQAGETSKDAAAAPLPGKPSPTEKQPKAAPESPEEKLPKAEQEIAQLKDQMLRLRADYDNFRKRSLREKGEIYENANEALMLELLPVLDHLQLAVKSAKEHLALNGVAGNKTAGPAERAFQEGLQLIFDQLMDTLVKYGLDPFNAEKQPFDPKLHEAISALPSATAPEGTVIAQSRQGYRFKNKLLRPAQVVVSGGAAPDSAPAKAEPEPADLELQPDGG